MITSLEKGILNSLDPRFKYIARDQDGKLFLYVTLPKKGYLTWFSFGVNVLCRLPLDNLFQFIKWSDDKPYLIKKYE